MMMMTTLLPIVCILVCSTASTIRAEHGLSCCKNCTCFQLENVFIKADCSGLGWSTIPPDIPHTVQFLDLSQNCLTSLPFKNLSQLKNLTHLNVSFNNITALEGWSWRRPDDRNDPDFSCRNNDDDDRRRFMPSIITRKPTDVGLEKVFPALQDKGQWRLHTLDVSHNLLTSIENNTFSCLTLLQILNISHNEITTLNPLSFSGLHSLLYLDLSGNRIPLATESYPEEVFSQLENLRELNLLRNTVSTGRHLAHNLTSTYQPSWNYPDRALQYLTSLQTLHVEGLPDVIPGTGFRNLTQLSFLDINNFGGVYALESLPEYFFSNITTRKLLSVSLQSCKLFFIHPNAFAHVPTLTDLSLQNNPMLGFDNFAVGSLSLNKTRIKTLDLTSINLRRRRYIKLLPEWFQHLRNTSLETLILDDNSIVDIPLKFPVILPRSLKMLSLSNNKLIWIPGLYTMYWLENLQIVDASIQNKFTQCGLAKNIDISEYTKFGANLFQSSDEKENSSAVAMEIGDNLTLTSNTNSACQSSLIDGRNDRQLSHDIISYNSFFQLQKNFCPSIKEKMFTLSKKDIKYKISQPNGLQHMYRLLAQGNISVSNPFPGPIPVPRSLKRLYVNKAKLGYAIPKVRFLNNVVEHLELTNNFLYCFGGPMYGLRKLKFFDLSNNYCIGVNPLFFSDMPKLETLLLTFNTLGPSLEADENGVTFSNMASLKYIDISHNDIRVLHSDAFSNTSKLQSVLLNNNAIHEFNTNIGHLMNLTLLDLSTNDISSLSHATMQNIENVLSVNPTLKVDIFNNPLRCDCSTIDFLKWYQLRKVIFRRRNLYHCQFLNGTLVKLEDVDKFYNPLWKNCNGTTFFVLALSGLFLMLIVWSSFGIYCIYRVKLLFYIYISKRRYFQNFIHPELHSVKDVFLVYDEDEPKWRRFVIDVVRPSLEDKGVSCFISEIEAMAGKPLKMVIEESVLKAKKTLVLLTRELFVIEDHELEVNMAMLSEEMRMSKVLYFLLLEDLSPESIPAHLRGYIEENRPIIYSGNHPLFWDHLARIIKSS